MKIENSNIDTKDFKQLIRDVALIKNILVSEGELTNWAKKELAKARAEKKEDYLSLEEL